MLTARQKLNVTALGFAVVTMAGLLSGCGTQSASNVTNTTNSTSPSVANSANSAVREGNSIIVGAAGYLGQANLKKFEQAAAQHPNDVKALIQAGAAAHVNQDDAKAIQYYKQAIKVDPKSAEAYTNLGNIYLRDKNNPKAALPYYQQAVKADSTYGYGWYNLLFTEGKLGQTTLEKQGIVKAMQQVSPSDPAYSLLKTLKSSLH
ncbi:tetratricopeptide repeat protein [Alicyclobacillaceae bacterium I2511]|nr:tetratricopeptide repeat protein [Alicyclobacillaceae bacterium I2511]